MNKYKSISWLILPIAILILGLRALQIYQPGILLDDAFISFRYAENLAQGHGLVFNPGEKVEGYTNFLWTVLLAGASWLKLDIPHASVAFAALAGIGCLSSIFLLANNLFHSRRNSVLLIAFPVFSFAIMGSQGRYIVSGMETLLFTFLLVFSIFIATNINPVHLNIRPFLAGVSFAACALVRPEGVMYFLIALTYLIGLTARGSSLALIQSPVKAGADHHPKDWKPVLLMAGGFLLIYGIYFIWRLNYYGDLLPNTYYVKAAGFSLERLKRGWEYFIQVIGWWSILPLLALALLGLQSGRRNPIWLLFLAFILATAVYFLYIGGDFIVWFGPRFFMPVLPFLLLLAAEGLANFEGLNLPNQVEFMAQVGLAATLLIYLYLYSWSFRTVGTSDFTTQTRGWAELGRWLAASTPPETTIATDAIGLIPYYSQRYTIDMFGLTDRNIAHLTMPDQGAGIVAHEKFDPHYVLGRAPDCIVSTWMDEKGTAISAGLDTVKEEFQSQYSLVAVAKVRKNPPTNNNWIIETSNYTPDLFNNGYISGVYCRK